MRRMFSEKQIKEMTLKNLENEDVKVKTIESSNPTWDAGDILNSLGNLPSGMTYEKKYAKLANYNGVVCLVWLFTLTNTTEESISSQPIANILLPTEIAEKIYDFSGKSAHELNTENISSTDGYYGISNELYSRLVFTLRNTNIENIVQIVPVSSLNVGAGATVKYSFRTFLTL